MIEDRKLRCCYKLIGAINEYVEYRDLTDPKFNATQAKEEDYDIILFVKNASEKELKKCIREK